MVVSITLIRVVKYAMLGYRLERKRLEERN